MKTVRHWLGHTLVVAATAALVTGCADQTPMGLESPNGGATRSAAPAVVTNAVDLGSCPDLKVDAGHEFVMRVYAVGFQNYHWTGTSWAFDGPSADLFADPRGKSKIGIHYPGPFWESLTGSKVKGAIVKRCTPDPDDIQWLLLGALSSEGPGVFNGVSFIQRVNTAGGIEPSYDGEFVGQQNSVPYTTEYLFYRPE